jgi:hypothetical protein
MAEGFIGVPDQSQNGINSGIGVKVVDTNEFSLISTTSAAAITSLGTNTVTPGSISGINVGTPLIIDSLVSGFQETVVVTAVAGGTFTASFRNLHNAGFTITLAVERQNFVIADPSNYNNFATVTGSALNVNFLGGVGSGSSNPEFAQLVGTSAISGTVSVSGNNYDGAGNLDVNLKTSLPSGSNTIGNVNINGVVPVSGTLTSTVSGLTFDTNGNLKVDLQTSIPSGTNAIGSVNVTGTSAVSGTVNVGNFPATQAVSGTVSITPSDTVAVSGTVSVSGLSFDGSGNLDVNLKTPLPSGTNALGSVTVSNFPATQAVSGTVALSGTSAVSGIVNVGNFPATQAVSGTVSANINGTVPVSGTVALSGTSAVSGTVNVGNTVAVSGTVSSNINGTVPVSGTVNVGNFPATQAVSGTVSILASDTVAVSGTVALSGTSAVSGTVSIGTALPSGANTIGNVNVNGTVPVSGSVSLLGTSAVSGSVSLATSLPSGSNLIGAVNLSQVGGVAVAAQSKGTQATEFIPVQSAIDTGRQLFSMFYDANVSGSSSGTAGVTTEALLSMSTNVNGTVTASQTSYTVPAGKTLRIQSFIAHVATNNGGIFTITELKFRANVSGGALSTTSPEFLNNIVTTGANNVDHSFMDVPDGFEFPAGAVLGIGQVSANTNTRFLSVSIVGFLY